MRRGPLPRHNAVQRVELRPRVLEASEQHLFLRAVSLAIRSLARQIVLDLIEQRAALGLFDDGKSPRGIALIAALEQDLDKMFINGGAIAEKGGSEAFGGQRAAQSLNQSH